MVRNVIVKARVEDSEKIEGLIFHFTDSLGSVADQEDVYFNVPEGRMKLRITNSNVSFSSIISIISLHIFLYSSQILFIISAKWPADLLPATEYRWAKNQSIVHHTSRRSVIA